VNNWVKRKEKDKGVLVISFLLPTLRSHFAKQVTGTALAPLIELFVKPKLKKTASLMKWSRAKQGLNVYAKHSVYSSIIEPCFVLSLVYSKFLRYSHKNHPM
jgi:hypothetical protein